MDGHPPDRSGDAPPDRSGDAPPDRSGDAPPDRSGDAPPDRSGDYAAAVAIKLHPGERVLFEGHPSWRAILGFYLKGVLIAVAAGVIAKLVSDSTSLVFAVVLVILVGTVVVGFVKRVATTYTITDRRLNIKRGIVSREIQETRLERVQNVNYNQSVYQRLMQIGDVDFDTAGSDDYNFVFEGVADPGDVVHTVDEATGIGAAGSHGLGEPTPPAGS
ncbi:MAG: PH domain-containing protein [Solirubrobacterales bacterium]